MSLRRFYYTFPCHLLFPETTGLQTLIYEIGILLFRNGGRFFLYHKIPCPPLREEGEWGTVAAPPPPAPPKVSVLRQLQDAEDGAVHLSE